MLPANIDGLFVRCWLVGNVSLQPHVSHVGNTDMRYSFFVPSPQEYMTPSQHVKAYVIVVSRLTQKRRGTDEIYSYH